jgi:hypothetical protein
MTIIMKIKFAVIALAFVVKVRVSVCYEKSGTIINICSNRACLRRQGTFMKRMGQGTDIAMQSMQSYPIPCMSVFVSVCLCILNMDATATTFAIFHYYCVLYYCTSATGTCIFSSLQDNTLYITDHQCPFLCS